MRKHPVSAFVRPLVLAWKTWQKKRPSISERETRSPAEIDRIVSGLTQASAQPTAAAKCPACEAPGATIASKWPSRDANAATLEVLTAMRCH
jgi:hypothetical protein